MLIITNLKFGAIKHFFLNIKCINSKEGKFLIYNSKKLLEFSTKVWKIYFIIFLVFYLYYLFINLIY